MKASLTQLLVHLDTSASAADRLELACRLAESHGAAVTGLYALISALPVLPYTPEGSIAIAAPLQDIDTERRNRAYARYEKVAAAAASRPQWAEVSQDTIIGVFAQQAFYADLMILGQSDPSAHYNGVPAALPESLMAASGKPALIVPYAGAPSPTGETIVIAWKPTPEAARAVSAAMPLLQRARQVHVISWGAADETVGGAGLDLQSYLGQSGVQAIVHRQDNEPADVGELLLSSAFDLNADLLVMGCYGHSRAREWVLGGASRAVLQSMTMPVLMSH